MLVGIVGQYLDKRADGMTDLEVEIAVQMMKNPESINIKSDVSDTIFTGLTYGVCALHEIILGNFTLQKNFNGTARHSYLKIQQVLILKSGVPWSEFRRKPVSKSTVDMKYYFLTLHG